MVGEGQGKDIFVVKHSRFQVGGSTPRVVAAGMQRENSGRCVARQGDRFRSVRCERASNPPKSHAGRIEPPAAGCDLTAHLV